MKKNWIIQLALVLAVSPIGVRVAHAQTETTKEKAVNIGAILSVVVAVGALSSSLDKASNDAQDASSQGSSSTMLKRVYMNNLKDQAASYLAQPENGAPHSLELVFEQMRILAVFKYGEVNNEILQMSDRELAAVLISSLKMEASQK